MDCLYVVVDDPLLVIAVVAVGTGVHLLVRLPRLVVHPLPVHLELLVAERGEPANCGADSTK